MTKSLGDPPRVPAIGTTSAAFRDLRLAEHRGWCLRRDQYRLRDLRDQVATAGLRVAFRRTAGTYWRGNGFGTVAAEYEVVVDGVVRGAYASDGHLRQPQRGFLDRRSARLEARLRRVPAQVHHRPRRLVAERQRTMRNTYIVTLNSVPYGRTSYRRRWVPEFDVVDAVAAALVDGWQNLLTNNTMALWRVQCNSKAQAVPQVMAHELGHAPHYTEKLWVKTPPSDPTAHLSDEWFADKKFTRDDYRHAVASLQRELNSPAFKAALEAIDRDQR